MSKIVSDEFLKIPGLHSYRGQNVGDDTTYSRNLNNLSHDIKDPKHPDYTYVCAHMAFSEGLVLQDAENYFLGNENPESENNLKIRGRYFFAAGCVLSAQGYKTALANGTLTDRGRGHAFILSSTSGNIIDATFDDGRQYKRSKMLYSLENFVLGIPFRASDNSWIYDPHTGRTPDEVNAKQQVSKTELLLKQNINDLDGRKVNSQIALSPDHSLALLTYTYADGKGVYYETYARTSEGPKELYIRTSKGTRNDLLELSLSNVDGELFKPIVEKDWSGHTTGLSLEKQAPKESSPAHQEHLSLKEQKALIQTIQKHLGLTQNGIWAPETSQRFANLMAEVQSTNSYKLQFDEKIRKDVWPRLC